MASFVLQKNGASECPNRERVRGAAYHLVRVGVRAGGGSQVRQAYIRSIDRLSSQSVTNSAWGIPPVSPVQVDFGTADRRGAGGEFCRARQVSEHSFYVWRRRLSEEREPVRFALAERERAASPGSRASGTGADQRRAAAHRGGGKHRVASGGFRGPRA